MIILFLLVNHFDEQVNLTNLLVKSFLLLTIILFDLYSLNINLLKFLKFIQSYFSENNYKFYLKNLIKLFISLVQ